MSTGLTIAQLVEKMGQRAKSASLKMMSVSTELKNRALWEMAKALEEQKDFVQVQNKRDLESGIASGLSGAMLDRLRLDDQRIGSMAKGIREVAALNDPVNEVLKEEKRPNGLHIRKIRVPLGVIGIIYESRPNVTADSACLCVKAGNACILRGGSEAIHSNRAIAEVLTHAIDVAGLPEGTIQLVDTTDRAVVPALARMDRYLSCIIPRGGEGLIRVVTEHATVPVIKHYNGICHVYVDEHANLDMAGRIVVNAKCQRPGVCNAMETLLIHRGVANSFLKQVGGVLISKNVELRMDPVAMKIWGEPGHQVRLATEEDWVTEYLDLILSIRVVDSLEQAIEHINRYGSAHSDSIVTGNEETAKRFFAEVDSATVYHNASTRFTDGYEFGMGAEIGISTDRIHARGPMALEELTTYKYVIEGQGQIRE